MLVELIQGEGGVNICGADYLTGLREICDANRWLLMLDEVQSGVDAPASGLRSSIQASSRMW